MSTSASDRFDAIIESGSAWQRVSAFSPCESSAFVASLLISRALLLIVPLLFCLHAAIFGLPTSFEGLVIYTVLEVAGFCIAVLFSKDVNLHNRYWTSWLGFVVVAMLVLAVVFVPADGRLYDLLVSLPLVLLLTVSLFGYLRGLAKLESLIIARQLLRYIDSLPEETRAAELALLYGPPSYFFSR